MATIRSMLIGVSAVITSGIIGITLGVLGGFFGGRIDDAVMFAITTRLSWPNACWQNFDADACKTAFCHHVTVGCTA